MIAINTCRARLHLRWFACSRDDSLLEFSALATVQLAHDLQNLLAAIGSCIDDLAAIGVANSGGACELRELNQAVAGAFRVTEELLAIVGLGTTAAPISTDVHELLTRYRSMMQRILGGKARLVMRMEAVTPVVLAAPVQLEWVLLNLVANARDAMSNGGLAFIETASIERWFGPIGAPVRKDNYLRLTVRDEGDGLSDHIKPRLFEPFFTTKDCGTGLGLTSVAVTIRALGGWLYVENGDRGGTSIHVLLPICTRG